MEARAIQRQFEWRNKLRDIEKNLKAVDSELRDASNMVVFPKISSNVPCFDADNLVDKVEEEVRESWDSETSRETSDFRKKLLKAHELLAKKSNSAPKPQVPRTVSTVTNNEWSTFAKFEQERRDFVEASYRRFRCGPVPEGPVPMRDQFDYDRTEMELSSGEKVQHPVAFIREASLHKDGFKSDVNRYTIGINTEAVDSDAIRESRLPPANSKPLEIDRQAFLSDLISKKAMMADPIKPGRTVEVSYYGVTFTGVVLKREIGSGSVTVRFDDGTESDFPMHAIMMKN